MLGSMRYQTRSAETCRPPAHRAAVSCLNLITRPSDARIQVDTVFNHQRILVGFSGTVFSCFVHLAHHAFERSICTAWA